MQTIRGPLALATLFFAWSLVGCVTPASEGSGGGRTAGPAAPLRSAEEGTLDPQYAVGYPCPDGSGSCWVGATSIVLLTTNASAISRATLEVSWNATTPAARDLEVRFYRDENPPRRIAAAGGLSPLVLELPIAEMRGSGYQLLAFPPSGGALAGESIHWRLVLERAPPERTGFAGARLQNG